MKKKDDLSKLISKTDLTPELKLEQWKKYVEMSNALSERRVSSNNFYLSANSLLIIMIGFLIEFEHYIWLSLIFVIGITFSLNWFYLISQYKNYNSAKFIVINAIEEDLPYRGFTVEWEIIKNNKIKLLKIPLSNIEKIIPSVLSVVYLISLTISLIVIF